MPVTVMARGNYLTRDYMSGATVFLSNHSEFDNAVSKIKILAGRKPGETNPFDLGVDAVGRYFKVTEECAEAARLRLLR
jgi:metallo-beta-lactamase class B